jgi:phage protein D
MDFAARSSASQGFYAPSASIALGSPDRDLLQAHGMAFSQVEVDLQLSVSGQFRFTIPDTWNAAKADFETARGGRALEMLQLGTRAWIWMGYGDRRGQTLLIAGYITAVSTGFAEGGSPELEVSGVDATYRLTLGTREHQFRDKSVRDAVAQVASDNDFSLRFAGEPPANVSLDANLQSDLDFLRKMAENFSTAEKKWEFYARPARSGDELHFRPRQTDTAPVGTLKWGVDLLSFKPEANLGDQVSKVEILSWDEANKKPIKGEAFRGREPGRGNGGMSPVVSGGEQQERIFGRPAVLRLRYPVKTQQEANERAAAELAKRATTFVKGDGETFGMPDLVPDTNLKLEGLGAKFSTTYYVEKTVHRYDGSGYRTLFNIQEATSK